MVKQRTPAWSHGASRLAVAASCLLIALSSAACLGGPHPLPPERGASIPMVATAATGGAQKPTLGAAGSASAVSTPAGTTPPIPVLGPASAGSSALGTAGGGTFGASDSAGAASPPPSAAAGAGAANPGSGAAGGGGIPSTTTDDSCHADVVLPRGTAPDNVLFLMDRSASMADQLQGEPRWQQTGDTLVGALKPIASNTLKLGMLFYPSSATAAPCVGPAWLCPVAPAMPTTCTVSSMAASDQVDMQPALQALTALTGPPALYQPVIGTGVPLSESIARVDAALPSEALSGRTEIVLLANAQPSCHWDRAQTSATLASWRTQRSIHTHVIALPGADPQGMATLTALAQAGGETTALSPASTDALRSELQSIVLGSLTSCTLTLDPVVSAAQDAHVIVGVHGVDQELPRTAADGGAQWSISADGKQLQLLGITCTAAQSGAYDSLRVLVGCVKYPLATP